MAVKYLIVLSKSTPCSIEDSDGYHSCHPMALLALLSRPARIMQWLSDACCNNIQQLVIMMSKHSIRWLDDRELR